MNRRSILIAIVCVSLAVPALGAARDVQIRSVDFTAGVLELFNFGGADESLAGWRFCSHDENQIRRYSTSGGLNAVTVEAGTSFFVHFNNDAPADSDHINISALSDQFGGFALPLDTGPYGIQIYFAPVNFFDGNTIADHVQWSIGGVDDLSADERSDEAEAGGVWTDQTQWVSTAADTDLIELLDLSGAELHGPDDYAALTGAGDVGSTLMVERTGGNLDLSWGASCQGGDVDYHVYGGSMSDFTSYDLVVCTTGGLTSDTIPMPGGDSFFLIVPSSGSAGGSYGLDGDGVERGPGGAVCEAQLLKGCP